MYNNACYSVSITCFFGEEKSELIEMPKTYSAKYSSQYVKQITPMYKDVGKDEIIYVALDMLRGTNGEFSRNAILGNNLSGKPVKIEFRDLGAITVNMQSLTLLDGKRRTSYIFI